MTSFIFRLIETVETAKTNARVRRLAFVLARFVCAVTLRRPRKRQRSFKVMDYVARKHRPRFNRFKDDDNGYDYDDDGIFVQFTHSSQLASSYAVQNSSCPFSPCPPSFYSRQPTNRPPSSTPFTPAD